MITLVHQSTTCLINKSEFRKLIMAKGKAGVSSSGAAMSKYDVEVEKRLQALEAEAHPKCNHDTAGGDCSSVEDKLDRLIDLLNSNNFFEGTSCPKDPDGVKRFH